jgi:hypothetical protein
MAIDMSPKAVKLRRFSFLSGYTLRNEAEEQEVHALDKYFHDINEHPGWPVWPQETIEQADQRQAQRRASKTTSISPQS